MSGGLIQGWILISILKNKIKAVLQVEKNNLMKTRAANQWNFCIDNCVYGRSDIGVYKKLFLY